MNDGEAVGVPEAAPPKKRRWRDLLGPGLITGASDDDPSGIATYSQVGAQFGYGMSWLMLFSYPLMCAIQEISARMGRTTGRGVAGNMRRHGPRWLVKPIVGLLLLRSSMSRSSRWRARCCRSGPNTSATSSC